MKKRSVKEISGLFIIAAMGFVFFLAPTLSRVIVEAVHGDGVLYENEIARSDKFSDMMLYATTVFMYIMGCLCVVMFIVQLYIINKTDDPKTKNPKKTPISSRQRKKDFSKK